MPRRQRLLLVSVVVLVLSKLAAPASADGKIFSTGLDQPSIPDQEAIIHFAEGVQTLIIETRFTAPATANVSGSSPEFSSTSQSFAWIVPIPAAEGPPEVFSVTRGTIPACRWMFAPRVIVRTPSWKNALAAAGIAALAFGIAFRVVSAREALLLIFLVLLVTIVSVPSLGGSGARSESDVSIHSRSTVGTLDVAVISAENSDSGDRALLSWLRSNGFSVPQEVAPVLATYAARGWCFVAARLAEEVTTQERLAPHPLAVRFRTSSPIYPMSLTGVGATDSLIVDLYVLGHRRAAADGFRVRRCVPVRHDSTSSRRSGISTAHPALATLIAGANIGTHLRATLSPEEMAHDIDIEWQDVVLHDKVKYTPSARMGTAVSVATGILAVCAVCVMTIALSRKSPRRVLTKSVLLSLALAVLSGLGCFMVLHPAEGTVRDRQGWLMEWSRNRDLVESLDAQLRARPVDAEPPTIDFVQGLVRSIVSDATHPLHAKHPSLQDMREEDSPGNYIIREGAGPFGVEFVTYDPTGEENPWRLGER